MERLKTMSFLTITAALLLVVACKSVETRSEAPQAPMVKNVKLMVPGAD
jgi:hypothetical protein